MKKVGFIGAFDKTDFILYIAKFITEMNKTVLLIDTTIAQKAKYIVPVINPTKSYFTEYEGIDVAVGFSSMEEILEYLGANEGMTLDYDFVFVDVDSPDAFYEFSMENAEMQYFVTSFDLYSLKKGLEVLSGLRHKVEMTKILFSKVMSKDDEEYLDFLSQNYNIEWKKESLHFPFEQGDQSVIIENQRTSKIRLKNLSPEYKQNIFILASQISENDNLKELNKIMKTLEKGA